MADSHDDNHDTKAEGAPESRARSDRLTLVLRVIREIDRIIVHEHQSDRLLERCCNKLVETRGYRAAWIALYEESPWGGLVVSSGWGAEFESLQPFLESGGLTACCECAREFGRAVLLSDPLAECDSHCPLCDQHRQFQTIIAPIRHNGRMFGSLSVSSPSGQGSDDEEVKLIDEISIDIGYALWGIHGNEALRSAERALARQLDIEQALAAIACNFVTMPGFDAALDFALETLGALCRADRSYLFLIQAESNTMDNTHEWCAPGVEPQIAQLQALPTAMFPWWMAKLAELDILHIPDVASLPAEAVAEREILESQSIVSVIVVPVILQNHLQGFVGFDNVKGTRNWTESDIRALRILSSLVGSALERRRGREAVQRSEEAYRELYDNAPVAFFTVDAVSGLIHTCNEAAAHQTGWSKQELVGRPIMDLYADSYDGKEFESEVIRRFVAGERVKGRDLQTRTKDGTIRDVTLWMEPKFDEQGRVVESRSAVIDVTEIKQMQVQLAQADRLASMGLLAAGVAHEINNPLTYILYNIESLAEELPAVAEALRHHHQTLITQLGGYTDPEVWARHAQILDPTAIKDMAERCREALEGTNRVRDIVRGLGTFSRVESERIEPTNVNHVIEYAINMAYTEIKYRARLVKEYQRIPDVMASDGRLGQVFLNLLVNAAHAIEEGDAENNEIRIRTWHENNTVFVEVRDTGRGIAPENLSRLFQPFFTTKPRGVGTGLGLSICQSIITSYGGRIDVKSQRGRGTSMVVQLPLQDREEELDSHSTDSISQPLIPRGKVLIVDDDRAVRTALARILKSQHDTVEAETGHEAMRIIEEDPTFDLILCDLMMPRVSGMDLHRWLCAEHPGLARQLIFVTGGVFTPGAAEYLATVDNPRLEKPFEAASLRQVVVDFVRSGRSE